MEASKGEVSTSSLRILSYFLGTSSFMMYIYIYIDVEVVYIALASMRPANWPLNICYNLTSVLLQSSWLNEHSVQANDIGSINTLLIWPGTHFPILPGVCQ